MSHELAVGAHVLFGGVLAEVIEQHDHAHIVIRVAKESGVQIVRNADVIPVVERPKQKEFSALASISEDVWDKASARVTELRAIAAAPFGRTQLVADAAKKLGLSPRTVWRLAKKHAQHDSIAKLIPQTSGRKPGAKVLDADVEVIIAGKIDSFYLSEESPTVKELHCRIAAECRKSGLSVPHVRSVARRVARRSDEQSLARRVGAKAAKYAARAMPGHVDVSKPLERVEIDHTPMDVIVKSDDPMCGYVGRPWLSMAIDVYSRVILGFLISFESPSSLSVALCLVHSMVQKNPEVEFGVPLDWPMYGKPKEIVVDNAREFDSVTLRRGCAEHGIILTYRPIGSPHFGGAIERLVGTMMGKCHLLPGTTKRSVAARGDYDAVKHACMTLSELRTWFAEQVLGNYHISEHRGLRVPPLVAWQRALGGHNE